MLNRIIERPIAVTMCIIALAVMGLLALRYIPVSLMPEIGRLIDRLRALGAGAAFMTGSGSAVVGAFDDPGQASRAARTLPGAILTRTSGEA